jgi:hypothetical protein
MEPEQINPMVEACLTHGFQAPLTWCAVSVNGAVLVVRYVYIPGSTTEMEARVLAEHFSEDGFALPAHVLVTDASGQGVHMVLQPEGWRFVDLPWGHAGCAAPGGRG